MMPSLPIAIFLTADGDETEIAVDANTTLREAAREAGVNVHDRCGGMGACCNCVVTVVEGAENICEKTLIEAAVFYLAAGDRLSCQCKITGDVVGEGKLSRHIRIAAQFIPNGGLRAMAGNHSQSLIQLVQPGLDGAFEGVKITTPKVGPTD